MAVRAGKNRRAEELDALPEKSLCRRPGGDLGAVFMANEDDQGEDRSTLPSQGWACKVAAKPSPEQNVPQTRKVTSVWHLAPCVIVDTVLAPTWVTWKAHL